MFATLFSIRAMLIAGAVALVLGFAGGWKSASVYYDAKATHLALDLEKKKNAALEENLRIIREALEADGKSSEEDLKKIEELKRKTEDDLKKIPDPDRSVLDAPAVDRLRDYFKRSR